MKQPTCRPSRASGLALLLLALAAGAHAENGAPLVTSTTPVSVGIRLQPTLYQAQLQVPQASTVTLRCPLVPGVISFAGLKQKTDVTYDARSHLLTISLPPGDYTLTIRPAP